MKCFKCKHEFCWNCKGSFIRYQHDQDMNKYCSQLNDMSALIGVITFVITLGKIIQLSPIFLNFLECQNIMSSDMPNAVWQFITSIRGFDVIYFIVVHIYNFFIIYCTIAGFPTLGPFLTVPYMLQMVATEFTWYASQYLVFELLFVLFIAAVATACALGFFGLKMMI